MKKGTIVVLFALPFSLFLSFSFTHTPVSARSFYIVYFRIGSLSTRDPPPSPLSYGPIVFSPSLPLSFPAVSLLLKTLQHHPNSSFPQNRESVWQFTRAILGTEARPPCPHALPVSPLPPLVLHRSAVPPAPRSVQYGRSPYPAILLLPFLLVLIPYSCVIYAGSG